jgi:4-hydroxy-tetrahydrodipicolinate reductase
LLAHGLGWPEPIIKETGEAVVARRKIRTKSLTVEKGQTCGLHQRAEGRLNGKVRLTLDLQMYLDAQNPHDSIRIEGDPRLDVRIEGGVAGDQATVGALLNIVPRLLEAPPGLRLMTDLLLPRPE